MAKAHTLADNFSDNARDTARWYAFGPVAETNQRLEVRLESGASFSQGGYTSVSSFDLTHSEVAVELVQPPRAGEASLRVTRDSDSNQLLILVSFGKLRFAQILAGVYTELDSIPYDAAAHRWLRLRERFGVVYWETSADQCTWTPGFSKAPPFDLTAVIVQVTAGSYAQAPSPGMAIFDNVNSPDTGRARRIDERRLSARDVRVEAAELAASRRHAEHANNNDEANYPGQPLIGNYSKGLRHDALGDPEPGSYATLLRALQSEDPADFEEITLGIIPSGAMRLKLTNPQAGLAFDTEGPDAQELAMAPAPRFDSEQAAHEAGELYWMAVARDVPFADWATQAATTGSIIQRAISSLNSEFPRFGGTVPVTAQNLFRGIYPGEQVGPYVSQFLWKGNNDPRKGRNANAGYISYGAREIDQRQHSAEVELDYLTTFSTWLDAQNGVDFRGQDDLYVSAKRFIRSLRDGATFVHFDQVLDAYYNAAWILMSEPTGNQLTAAGAGRPQIDLEFPKDQGNPYDPPGTAMDSRTQVGFATFGPIHLLQVLSEVLGRAIRAVWWQKWGVHRRLRPEEYGGRVHNQVLHTSNGGALGRAYPIHSSITTSLSSGGLSGYFGNTGEKFPSSYLLPQAYPEGAPTHPAYGAGHATGSGACATILKAFFDESTPIENPVQASADGFSLVAYTGADAGQMTVGGELNKLAGNVAIFRNAAGVHWRSDYTESVVFGEAVAIRMLQEMSLTFNEDDAFFQLTKFDGTTIRIFDGKVVPVV